MSPFNPGLEQLADFVRHTRAGKNLTLVELQKRGGPAPSWVSKLESGMMIDTPKPSTLARLATGLGVPVEEVMRAAGLPVVMETAPVSTGQEGANHEGIMVSGVLNPQTKEPQGVKVSEQTEHDLSMGGSFEGIPNSRPLGGLVRLPLFGPVSCGEPSWIPEQAEGYFNWPEFMVNGAEAAIPVRGASMVGSGYKEGDILFVKMLHGERPYSGEDVVVCIDGEYTCATYRSDGFGEYLEKRPDHGEAVRYPIQGETRVHALVVGRYESRRRR